MEFKFRRFVNGQERAEGVTIAKAKTLEEAISAAVRLAPERGTVLVHDAGGRAEALEEAAKLADKTVLWNLTKAMAAANERSRFIAAAIRALKDKPANQTEGGE